MWEWGGGGTFAKKSWKDVKVGLKNGKENIKNLQDFQLLLKIYYLDFEVLKWLWSEKTRTKLPYGSSD